MFDDARVYKNEIAASAAVKPAYSDVAWWWFALGGLTVLALLGAPVAVRHRAADRDR